MLSVKEWRKKKSSEHQFMMYMAIPDYVVRICDGVIFSYSLDERFILYDNRDGMILEFMSDYINVKIEVKKPGVSYTGMEFDSENYEILYVPINDLTRRVWKL